MTAGETAHDVNPFRYVGAYGVRWQDSTLGMYHMGARFYAPGVGRFTQRDPIGYKGGLNLYGYVGNNPVNYIDPSGNIVWGIVNPGTIITVGTYVLAGAAVAYGGYLIYQHYSSQCNSSTNPVVRPSLIYPVVPNYEECELVKEKPSNKCDPETGRKLKICLYACQDSTGYFPPLPVPLEALECPDKITLPFSAR